MKIENRTSHWADTLEGCFFLLCFCLFPQLCAFAINSIEGGTTKTRSSESHAVYAIWPDLSGGVQEFSKDKIVNIFHYESIAILEKSLL